MKLRERTTATLLIAIIMTSTMFTVSVIAKKGGVKIQDGTITDINDNPITVGYDEFGYNYQAHLFNGLYDDSDRVHGGENPDVYLIMKWNDAWLSNMDRGTQVGRAHYTDLFTPDGKLDRHYPLDNNIGSGAWCTNHQFGSYIEDGKECKWNYFVKIVAAPEGAYKDSGVWYSEDDVEIGLVIWGEFAIIQRVYNDQGTGEHGIEYLSPVSAGLGCYK